MTPLFNTILSPLRGMYPFAGLLAVSLVFGVFMIVVFRFTSDQKAIGRIRRRMGARALGMLLHLHSPLTVLKSAAALMADNFAYLWLILRPMLVMAIPFLITAAQLDARYGTMPMPRGTSTTVTVTWNEMPARNSLTIGGTGLSVIEPVVFIDTLGETSFRVSSGLPGAVITIGDDSFPAGASAEGSGRIIYRGAARGGFPGRLMTPFLSGIDEGSPVSALRIDLAEARYRILGGRWSWLGVFLFYSSLSAIAGAAAFKVKV